MLEDQLVAASRLVAAQLIGAFLRRKPFLVYGGFAKAINV